MRLALLAPLLPVLAVAFAPLACSSTATSDDSAVDNDSGDQGGDEGGNTNDGGGTPDTSVPFSPGPYPNTYPQVPNNGGGVMTNPRVVVILPSGESTVTNFGTSFVASNTFAAVASEYGLGTGTASPPIMGGAITTGGLDPNTIQSYIGTTLNAAANAALRPDGKTIYLVILPVASWILYDEDGTLVSEQGCHENGDPSNGGVGGYHVPYGNNGDGWGVVQHCTGLVDQTDAQVIEIAASHEVIEAATDVDGQSGYALPQVQQDATQTSIWDDILLSEIGDLCVGTSISEGSYTYQRFWSNKAAASSADPCIPAIPTYFNAGTVGGDTNGWIKATGTTVTIPIEAFSTAPLDPWIVASATGTQDYTSSGDTWTIGAVTGTGTNMGQATMGNGDKGSIVVTVPSSATSGAWAEFELVSYAGIPGENQHLWPFGVYVP